jgi:hypothetical protein
MGSQRNVKSGQHRGRAKIQRSAFFVRAVLKIAKGLFFAEKAGWRGATRAHPRRGLELRAKKPDGILRENPPKAESGLFISWAFL